MLLAFRPIVPFGGSESTVHSKFYMGARFDVETPSEDAVTVLISDACRSACQDGQRRVDITLKTRDSCQQQP